MNLIKIVSCVAEWGERETVILKVESLSIQRSLSFFFLFDDLKHQQCKKQTCSEVKNSDNKKLNTINFILKNEHKKF